MARPRRSQASRAAGLSSAPTPVASVHTTPLSSAYPSAYPSEDESEYSVQNISIGALSLDSALVAKTSKRTKPFRFLDLPAELRLKVYGYHFANCGDVVDLDPANVKQIRGKLNLLGTCRQVYQEASAEFFGSRAFRVFPTNSNYFKRKRPLLALLKPKQRGQLKTLELRLGPGWNKPPKNWKVNKLLGLQDCSKVRSLRVFVECDPSDTIFNGFRRADGFYEDFCRSLLMDVLAALPSLDTIEFDAWQSVKISGAMMKTLLGVVAMRYNIKFGPGRGWVNVGHEAIVPNSLATRTQALVELVAA